LNRFFCYDFSKSFFAILAKISSFLQVNKIADCCSDVATDYVRHPMYGGLLMASFGLAVITRSETRLAMAVLLWVVLQKKVRRWHCRACTAANLCHFVRRICEACICGVPA
jgi:protein-S-isoprenylcysteine O-methyltransferase Ste14